MTVKLVLLLNRTRTGCAWLVGEHLRHLVVWQSIVVKVIASCRQTHLILIETTGFVLRKTGTTELVAVSLLESKVLLSAEEIVLVFLWSDLDIFGTCAQLFDETLSAFVSNVVPVLG